MFVFVRVPLAALVFVDARGVSANLPREAIRFAPGRADGAAYNPLLAIRGGAHAWEDARRWASAFLQSGDSATADAFAALMLDQLLAAPLERRRPTALRNRLADPRRVLAEMCAAWDHAHFVAAPPLGEIARAIELWRREPNSALAAFARIDAALGLLGDGRYAEAMAAHQFRFADLVTDERPSTLVIAPPPGDATRASPLIASLLAQLVAECAIAPDVDYLGRRKKREMLVVIEAEACRALSGSTHAPLIPGFAAANGCHTFIQTESVDEGARLLSGGIDAFAAVAAVGPQDVANAELLSERGGTLAFWRRARTYRPVWGEVLFPVWEKENRPIVSETDLRDVPAEAAHLFVKTLRPIRARALVGGKGRARFVSGAELKPVAPDWTAPPLSRSPDPGAGAPSASPGAKPIGAQIRRALTRTPPPKSKPEDEKRL